MSSDTQPQPAYALRMVVNGQERKITYQELALSNNLAQEALVRLLVRKKLIDPNELLEEINTVKNERYRIDPGESPPGGTVG
jgi:hypothetical protein